MKKLFTIIIIALIFATTFLTQFVLAQTSDNINYQAVIRDRDGHLMANHEIGIQISIFQGAIGNTPAYVERHYPTTNANGLVTLIIGFGDVIVGDYCSIDWTNLPFFLRTETDINGGENYTILGDSPLYAVSYALHAKTADSIVNVVLETDPVFSESTAFGITEVDTANWNNKLEIEVDGDITNELQELSISEDTIFITDGGWVVLPPETDTTEFKQGFLSFDPAGSTIGSKGKFTYYSRIGESTYYLAYTIENEYDMSELAYKDIYRITRAFIFDYSTGVMVATGLTAIASGESEYVYHTVEADDFTGGVHGDELQTEFTAFNNKVKVTDLSTAFDLMECDEFMYIQKSTTHQTAISGVIDHTIEGIHHKKTVFKDGGYESFNRVIWQKTMAINVLYAGISCIGTEITDFVQNENFIPEEFIEDGGYRIEGIGKEVHYWGNDYGVMIYAYSSVNDDSSIQFVWDKSNYHKYYRNSVVTGYLTPVLNDVYESLMKVEFYKK